MKKLTNILPGILGFVALICCVAFIVTQQYEFIFGGIILAAAITFYYLESHVK